MSPDARGHGHSSAPSDGYTYDDLANDVDGLIDNLELQQPVLVGHSMGGLTAAVVAARRPTHLAGLVLVDPSFLDPDRQREVWESDVIEQHRDALDVPMSDLVAQARIRHPHRPLELIELQAAARLRTNLNAMQILAPPTPDYRNLVRAINVPTLLVFGDAGIITQQVATELCDSNPSMRAEQIVGAGHGLPFDKPERLAQLVRTFLQRIG